LIIALILANQIHKKVLKMNTFLIKLILMPLIIATVTLVSKKWGNSIGGILASLPWVAGPIILFIAYEQGIDFAANSISGSMIGIMGWFAFCAVYILIGQKYNVFLSVVGGYLVYLLVAAALNPYIKILNVYQWFILSLLVLSIGLRYFPSVKSGIKHTGKKLRFEIPLRMLVITLFVILLTYFAEKMGPNWSGILTPFPIMTAVLGVFTHYTQGIYQVRTIFIGLFTGLFGFTLFLFLQAILMPRYGIFVSFSIGVLLDVMVTYVTKVLFSRLRII
jgi:uncharacterized membrane protein (GlpM family)